MKILVKLSVDYGDEFDCHMFALREATSIEALRGKLLDSATKHRGKEVYFGTNEELLIDPAYFVQGGRREAMFTELTDETYNTMVGLFGHTFGTGKALFDALLNSEDFFDEE